MDPDRSQSRRRQCSTRACARLGGGGGGATTTTMSMSTKATTGIVGLKVLDDAHNAYASKVREVLKAVRVGIPADAGYRQVVEQVYEGHLKALEANAGDVEAVERALGLGQIEELYAVAEDELALIPKMREWKPWEFDHEIEVIEEPKNPYLEEAKKE